MWDVKSIDHLPKYVKLCYVELLHVYKEIEEEMDKEGNQYQVQYVIEAVRHFAFDFVLYSNIGLYM